MKYQKRWTFIINFGYVLMLIGAIDPLEGSLIILTGSFVVWFGTCLGQLDSQLKTDRLIVFILIAIGIGSMIGLSIAGGIGGNSGRSFWWSILILPYLLGWSMGVWGWSSPRWVQWAGIAVGLLYLTMYVISLVKGGYLSQGNFIAGLGLLTIGGCIYRLMKRVRV